MIARNDAPCFVDETAHIPDSVPSLPSSSEADDATPPDVRGEQWSNACRRLRAELGEAVFGAWFARLELDRVVDDTAYLSVPTNFLKTWIQSHYVDKLCATLAAEASDVKRCVIGLRTSSRLAPKAVQPPETGAR